MQIIVEVQYLYKRLKTIITLSRDLLNTITIIIVFDTLYDNFDTITTSFLKISNKTIDQIQNIL